MSSKLTGSVVLTFKVVLKFKSGTESGVIVTFGDSAI